MMFCEKGVANTEVTLGMLMSIPEKHREEIMHKVHNTESELELQNS